MLENAGKVGLTSCLLNMNIVIETYSSVSPELIISNLNICTIILVIEVWKRVQNKIGLLEFSNVKLMSLKPFY